MLEFQSMKTIRIEISRDDCYSSYERSLTKIPDMQQYSAAILPLGKFRAIGEKRWRMVEHQKAVRADTELHVLVAEIAQVIVDVINHQNLKQVGACPRTTAK
jgi:predicted Zn-dependent protease